jgi:hypothetical protein
MYARTMTVGKVSKVFSNGWVEVDPQIQMVERDNQGVETPVSIGVLSRIPVGLFKAGGFILTLPVAPGDEGIILFSDRGLSLWKETGKKAPPRETEFHGLNGAVFVPFPTSKPGAIQGFDGANMYVGTEDQSAYLRIGKTGDARLFAGTKLTLDSPLTEITGLLNVMGNTTLQAELLVQLLTHLVGNVTTEGTVTSAGNHFAPAFIPV